MDLLDKIKILANKAIQIGSSLDTEEATKNALVMPFISSVLGYDVFDPREVIPEFTADVGTKKGEKVDYVLCKEGEVQILMECKKYSEPLSLNHAGQLFRYFSVTQARIAVLTNGRQYLFFTDLDAPNKMDEKPYLELDLENIDEHAIPTIAKLTKQDFDLESLLASAEELKYIQAFKRIINTQFKEPTEDFVRVFTSREFDGKLTASMLDQFTKITVTALSQYLNDKVNERLKSAMDTGEKVLQGVDLVDPKEGAPSEDEFEATPTQEEVEALYIVRSIIRDVVSHDRVFQRKSQSYASILLDDNNRKSICRLHFNNPNRKFLGVLDANKVEMRFAINSLDQIYLHADAIKSRALNYAQVKESGAESQASN